MTTDQLRLFRNALGCFATGVCVITAKTDNGVVGLTVNSFASVSLDPPLVLWSLDRASDRAEAFHIADYFAVNVLGEEQKELSATLAKKGAHAVPDDLLDPGPHHVPIIHGALAQFICSVEARYDGGDHVIFIGRVQQFHHRDDGTPLVYYRGGYKSLGDA